MIWRSIDSNTKWLHNTAIMSKIKSAPEKKRDRLLKDRRNLWGESGARSRYSIRRNKQLDHMALRRAVVEELRSVKGTSTEADAESAEARARDRIVDIKQSSFRKSPDQPLAIAVRRKKEKRGVIPERQSDYSDIWGRQRRRDEERMIRKMRRK